MRSDQQNLGCDVLARLANVDLAIQPSKGLEVKRVMKKGAQATYSWRADKGMVNYELHGDSANAPANDYISYKKGSGVSADSGLVTAAFNGFHGWFWQNRMTEVVTITLKTRGGGVQRGEEAVGLLGACERESAVQVLGRRSGVSSWGFAARMSFRP